MPKGLDEFLGEPEEPEVAAVVTPEPEAVEVPVEPQADAKAEPDAPDEDVDVPQDPNGFKFAVNKIRKDFKGRSERLEGELTGANTLIQTLKQQLEELKKAPPAPPQPAQQQAPAYEPPDAKSDPEGYVLYHNQQTLLNTSELLLREKEGDEAVDKAVETFKAMCQTNPAIAAGLQGQKNPYRWMFNEVKRHEAMKEIGPDPETFKATIREQLRAELMAEMGQQAPQQAAQIVLPQSLGTARSAAPRSAETWTGPEDLDDIVKGGRRKRA